MARILVVDDDLDLAEMLGIVLTSSGFDVDLVNRGDEALEAFRNNPPDLVLLDVMLPGLDGIEVCTLIRKESVVPIVMLSAKGETLDIVRGLEAGADDYMQKPFRDEAELIARIRTRLRRTNADVTGVLTIGDLTIDVTAHEIHRGAKAITLTRLEFDLLVALAKDPGRVFTRDALLSEVWGYRHSTDTRLVNVHVQRLRSKIEHDPEHPEIVMTVRGVGYKAGGAS
ncbi:OmpR Response regulators consisting of a CheY-like receiver domain and a winged-helix DNA-binding domain [Candidatus Nanopelagicaceae bacterium]